MAPALHGKGHQLLERLRPFGLQMGPNCSFTWLAAAFLEFSGKKGDVYNLLWALVFGFATLNILSLVSKRFEPERNRMTFGEMMAVGTVCVSVVLLGWEMLHLFRILPIRLSPR